MRQFTHGMAAAAFVFAFFGAFTGALTGCSGSTSAPGLDSQSQSRPEWMVEIKSTCADGSTDSCIAAYTYSIGADGMYRVGPGPEGQTLSGKLPSDEFSAARDLIAQISSAARESGVSQICTPSRAEGSTDVIQWVKHSGDKKELVRSDEQNFCFHLESPELAQKLHDLMVDSAGKHYPVPFPDDGCDNATASLDALYGVARACQHDSDCAYFDDSLQPVASDMFTFIIAGDCSGANPLVVGNKNSVLDKRAALLEAITTAREACKKRAISACDGFSEFQPTRPGPVCSAGVCRAS